MQLRLASVLALLLPIAATMPASAGGLRLGILNCEIDGGMGYVLGSHKTVDCSFKPSHGGAREHYTGIISKVGIDIGVTDQGTLQWAVLTAGHGYEEGLLAGNYYG